MGTISAGAKRFRRLKRCDVKAACYSPPKAAAPTVSGLVWSENKEVSILRKLRPFSFLCLVAAAGAAALAGPGAVLDFLFIDLFIYIALEIKALTSAFDFKVFLCVQKHAPHAHQQVLPHMFECVSPVSACSIG